ncbi:hypothetical protein FQN57_004691 [Myotisia sp. PD_48]|nr:hypothetical protein FQN57_004691 [Myotisia sp. PD_48]
MRRPGRVWASRPVFVFFLFCVCLAFLAGQAEAQGNSRTQTTSNSVQRPETTSRPTASSTRPTNRPQPTSDNDDEDNDDDTTTTPRAPTPSPTQPPDETDSQDLPNLSSSTESSESSESPTSSFTGGVTDTDDFVMPSLTGVVAIPTAKVPSKKNAPYLRKSNLPEGTIFIVVGAVLGLLGMAVFAWRAIVAWSINRSVRRAANEHHQSSDATALLHSNKRKTKPYHQPPGTSMSMEKLGSNSGHRNSGLPRGGHAPNPSLFFSPTAGASMHTPGNRSSGYLPAGYYAASGAAPGGGTGLAHLSSSSIGLSPLGPQSQGYSRTRSTGPSPPGSPGLPPSSRGYEQGHPSTSSLNLTSPPQGRAPSAYLEDLFENHPPGR